MIQVLLQEKPLNILNNIHPDMSLLLYMIDGNFMLYSIVMIYSHKPSRGVTYASHIVKATATDNIVVYKAL